MRRGALPALLFLLAAGGTLFLGSRILASERSSAERTARERLRARAREAAGILVAEASRLLREAATGTPDAVRASDGTFLKPAMRIPLERLAPREARDPEADFYLAEAERAESVDRDLDRAFGLYRAAAVGGRNPEYRLAALYRMAALHRRLGEDRAGASLEALFLAALPPERRRTFESLVVRARATTPDSDLRRDLLLLLGGEDEGIAVGLLRSAGIRDSAAEAARREELAIMACVERSAPRTTERTPFTMAGRNRRTFGGTTMEPTKGGVRIGDGWIVAFARAADGTDHFRITGIPELPDGSSVEVPVETVMARIPHEPPGIVETAEVGDPLYGHRIRAFQSFSGIEADARRGAWMLGGALAALLLAGGAALVLSVRAARRETEAARARADFVTKVGHDLRTPLAVVRMYAETLAAGRVADPAEAREFAGIAAREAERLTGMVGQVLDLSRVAEEGGGLARRPLDLAALAAEVAEVHRPLLHHAGIRLVVRSTGPLPVLGDSASLRGAVSNLLENAGCHGGSGGSVEIEAVRDGTMAAVRVMDRGPGLPPGMEERVFERFVRGPGAVGSGAGLGLALVREAAEAHAGTAQAADREGGGAVFSVSVPLEKEEA